MEKNKYNINKDELIHLLTDELPVLRAKIGITQEELCDMVGISRQAYSPIETKKKKMSWNIFLVLLFFYSSNEHTKPMIDALGLFPDELKIMMNVNHRNKVDIN